MSKTCMGKTAGGILKTAQVRATTAGLSAVFVTVRGREYAANSAPSYPGSSRFTALELRDAGGSVVVLETSVAAFGKLIRLLAAREQGQ